MKTLKEYISTADGLMQMWDDINDILDDFDFGTVYAAMEALEWTWAIDDDGDGEYEERQPEVRELQKKARQMIVDLIMSLADKGESEGFSNGGGFEVGVKVIDDQERARVFGKDAPDEFRYSVELKLRFIIAENIPKTW